MRNRCSILLFVATLTGYAQQYTITTIAGGSPIPSNAPATSVPIGNPGVVANDSAGGVYFVSADCVFKVDATGMLVRVAGNSRVGFSGDGSPATSAQLNNPGGLAIDTAFNIYIADSANNRIRKVTTNGIISTIAGTGAAGYSGDNGPAGSAVLNNPQGIAVDTAGNIYIADSGNHVIRKINPGGVITTIAGNGTPGFSGDGNVPTSAQLNQPAAVALDGSGAIYIADSMNHRVRKIFNTGTIGTIAGTGAAGFSGEGGPAVLAQLNLPNAITVDPAGQVYVIDVNTDGSRVRKIPPNNTIVTVAGVGINGVSQPAGIATDANSNLFVADSRTAYVVRIPFAGAPTIVAGNGQHYYLGDNGPATSAQLLSPQGLAVDINGIYLADRQQALVRKISGNGTITTLASAAGPSAVAVDNAGNFYIADTSSNRVLKIPAGGTVAPFAGTGAAGFSGDGQPALSAQLNQPAGVAVDPSGNVYIADTGNNRIRKVNPLGLIVTYAGTGAAGFSGDAGVSTNAQFNQPSGVAADASGNVFVADTNNNRIRQISAAGIVSTVAGNGNRSSTGDNGMANAASILTPHAVALDKTGNLYITDFNARVRKVSTGGIITTIAGNGTPGYSGDSGPALSAQLNQPWGIAVDGGGNVYVSDVGEQAIRYLVPIPAPPLSITTPSPLPNGTVGTPYAAALSATGGTPPYTWSTIFGTLPGGLTLSPSGSIIGTPTFSGSALVTFQVTDSASVTATATLGIVISPSNASGLSITTVPSLVPGVVGNIYSQAFTAAGGSQPYTWALTSGNVPPGMSFTNSGVLSGIPTAPGNYTFTVRVVDAASSIASQNFSITVVAAAPLTRTAVFGHIAAGGTWTTRVYLTNISSSPVVLDLVFHGDDGSPLTMPVTVIQQGISQVITTSSLNTAMGPNTTMVVDMGSLVSTLATGWIDVQSSASAALAGFAIFRTASGASISEGTTPLQSQLQPKVDVPFDNTGGYVTAVALANLASTSTLVAVSVLDSNGNQIGTYSLSLDANKHQSFLFTDQFAVTAGKQGVVQLTSSGGNLAAVALRANLATVAFTSVPVVFP